MFDQLKENKRLMERDSFAKCRKYRVLQVAGVPVTFEKLLAPLVDALIEEGYEVDLCCGKGEYLDSLRDRGYRVNVVPFSREAFSLSHVKTFLAVFRLLRKQRYGIVHFHTPIMSAIGRVAARLAGVPIIIHTVHGFYFHENMNPIANKCLFCLERTLARFATDWLFMVSKEDEALARESKFLKNQERIVWVANGVDPERFEIHENREDLRKKLGINADDVAVALMGRVVREKGCIELIKAFSIIKDKCRNVKLLFIGGTLSSDRDKTTAEELDGIIQKEKLRDDVMFLGFRDDVPQLLFAIDIFVLPSYREGLPVSVIEAMMSGKPVIATNIRGCREEVIDGETGLIVEPGDVNGLAGALERLINNPDLAKTMGERGKERALLYFNEDLTISRQLEAYRKAVSSLEGQPREKRRRQINRFNSLSS